MLNETFILRLACLLLATAIVVKFVEPANAQRAIEGGGLGQFMLVAHSNPNANAGVFRIDTTTGAVSYCFMSGVNQANLACTGSVQ